MKKAKIVLIISVLIFAVLLGYYFYTVKASEKTEVVSQRELYQQMLKEEEEGAE